MNIKKQLRKIRDYVEELETSSDKEHEELRQYQLIAHKFVDHDIPAQDAREEFKALLGDTMFVGGNFSGDDVMEKIVNNAWVPMRPNRDEVHYGSNHVIQEYSDLVKENARLREALRWHPVSELPDLDEECVSSWSKNVVFQVDRLVDLELAFYDFHVCYWRNLKTLELIKTFPQSRWCYIPEYKDRE